MTGPAHPVSWAPGPAMPPAAWPSAPRPSLPVPALLRLLAGVLLGLAGALVAVGTFPNLVSLEARTNRYDLSGWHETLTGSVTADPMHLGIPLVVAAAALLGAAGLAIATLWRPGLRSGALAAAVAAAGLTTAQVWAIGFSVADLLALAGQGGDSVHGARGAGFWLELTGMVFALLALVLLTAAELAALRRPAPAPASTPASAAPVAGPPDWMAGPVAGPAAWGEAR